MLPLSVLRWVGLCWNPWPHKHPCLFHVYRCVLRSFWCDHCLCFCVHYRSHRRLCCTCYRLLYDHHFPGRHFIYPSGSLPDLTTRWSCAICDLSSTQIHRFFPIPIVVASIFTRTYMALSPTDIGAVVVTYIIVNESEGPQLTLRQGCHNCHHLHHWLSCFRSPYLLLIKSFFACIDTFGTAPPPEGVGRQMHVGAIMFDQTSQEEAVLLLLSVVGTLVCPSLLSIIMVYCLPHPYHIPPYLIKIFQGGTW